MSQELPPAVRTQVARLRQLQEEMQAVVLRKQQWQLQNAEMEQALKELKRTTEDRAVFKIVGSIMVSKDKESLIGEMTERKEAVGIRISKLEKQEKLLLKQIRSLESKLREQLSPREAALEDIS